MTRNRAGARNGESRPAMAARAWTASPEAVTDEPHASTKAAQQRQRGHGQQVQRQPRPKQASNGSKGMDSKSRGSDRRNTCKWTPETEAAWTASPEAATDTPCADQSPHDPRIDRAASMSQSSCMLASWHSKNVVHLFQSPLFRSSHQLSKKEQKGVNGRLAASLR
jgi:hypothetical protein